MINSKILVVFMFLVWTLLISACNSVTPAPTPTRESVTSISTELFLNTPVFTLTPMPPVTNSPVPTLTPVPTLPIAKAKTMVLALYETNSDCKLPCWWGIVPGESSWSITRNFLASFAERISPPSTSDFFGKVKGYSIYFPFDTKSGNRLSLGIMEQDDLIKFLSASVNEELERANNSTRYFMYSLLAEYGAPDEVYLYTQPYTPDNTFPFSVILFYNNQRFALVYMEDGTLQNNQIRACFKNNVSILSWAPDTISELGDLKNAGMSPEDIRQYRRLQEVTKLDVTTFDETFKDPSTPFCLETPVKLWP